MGELFGIACSLVNGCSRKDAFVSSGRGTSDEAPYHRERSGSSARVILRADAVVSSVGRGNPQRGRVGGIDRETPATARRCEVIWILRSIGERHSRSDIFSRAAITCCSLIHLSALPVQRPTRFL